MIIWKQNDKTKIKTRKSNLLKFDKKSDQILLWDSEKNYLCQIYFIKTTSPTKIIYEHF